MNYKLNTWRSIKVRCCCTSLLCAYYNPERSSLHLSGKSLTMPLPLHCSSNSNSESLIFAECLPVLSIARHRLSPGHRTGSSPLLFEKSKFPRYTNIICFILFYPGHGEIKGLIFTWDLKLCLELSLCHLLVGFSSCRYQIGSYIMAMT